MRSASEVPDRNHLLSVRSALPLCILGVLLAAGACAPARADFVTAINAARAAGCNGQGPRRPLRSSAKLGEVARHLYGAESLRDSMDAVGYHAIKSTSIHMSGWLTESVVARNLSRRFCASLSDADLTEIGFYRSGRELWLVLAQPFSTLTLSNPAAISQRVLELTNEARSHARLCGRQPFSAVAPLALSAALHRAAVVHSRDMATGNYFEHQGRDGSQPADRVSRQDYKWRVVGENLAAGITTPEEAVKGWLASPHHCANLMDPRFTQMGLAYAVDPASTLGIYWTQVFALPRN